MSDEEKLKRLIRSYELSSAPDGISRQLKSRIKRRRFWHSVRFRLAALGGAGLIFAGCWSLVVWRPVQDLAATFYAGCGALFPTSTTGLLWYSAIWVTISLTIFGATLLVASGLKTLEE